MEDHTVLRYKEQQALLSKGLMNDSFYRQAEGIPDPKKKKKKNVSQTPAKTPAKAGLF